MAALRQLDTDLWVAERPLPLWVGDVGTRMTVIRLADAGLFLHSPVRLDDATRKAVDALGPVRAVVAPSKVHHFFVPDYVTAYPTAQIYGAPGLAAKRRAIRDRRAARALIDRILTWDFDRVIVTHGDVLERGGRAAVTSAFAFL